MMQPIGCIFDSVNQWTLDIKAVLRDKGSSLGAFRGEVLMKRIALGSTSTHKIKAVQEACARLGLDAEVIGCKTDSGQDEQPVGFAATVAGAKERALAAQRQHPDLPCVGIESGILQFRGVTIDFAVIAVLMPDGEWYFATSPGIRFPEECAEAARRRGFATTTVGSVIAQTLGGDNTDPHATLTQGRIKRLGTLVEGLRLAFSQVPAW